MLNRKLLAAVAGSLLLSGIVVLVIASSDRSRLAIATSKPAPVQSPQSQAPRATAPAPLSGIMPPTPAAERPHPDPFETIRPTKENIRTMIGRHFWTGPSFEGYRFMRYCPPRGTESCLNYPSPSKVEDNTGFTVAGVSEPPTGAYANLADDQIYVKVRLDDGRTGYGRLDDAFWYTQDPQLRKQAVHERVTRALADCQRRPSIAIGMTEREVLVSKWGNRSGENTTETAGHSRVQWIYGGGPECNEDSSPGLGVGKPSYLSFDNGRLVAIQR
jgi:hypothetical protein